MGRKVESNSPCGFFLPLFTIKKVERRVVGNGKRKSKVVFEPKRLWVYYS